MAKCKACHRDITRYYNDICPFCGEPNPIDSNYKTKDMTQFLDPVTGEPLYKSKSKLMTCMFQLFLGWAGVADFYLGFVKNAIIKILITLAVVGGLGTALFMFMPDNGGFTLHMNPLAYVIPFIVVFLGHAILSIRYFLNDSLKDSKGEFTH
ncbi:MAG: TM2 domain-containing protein [Bacilli bacterium]|nr:TM2 domain-containing protein [Bacilli bacterium]